MTLEPSHYITLGLAVLGFIGWLYRLEAKVHKNEAAIEANRDGLSAKIAVLDRAQGAHEAKADAEARASRETRETLIRMEEQIKHLIDLVERQAPARRRPPS